LQQQEMFYVLKVLVQVAECFAAAAAAAGGAVHAWIVSFQLFLDDDSSCAGRPTMT
jgi:hypothetical protein